MDVKKIVELTNEQYETLLKTGQVEVDGETKIYDENITYICPTSESWSELNNKIDNVLIKPFKVLHNPYSIEELDTIIARLRKTYNETDSVVGFRCIMKKGQQLKTNANYNMYLNETLREYDYTCENDNEMISIVLFAKSGSLNVTSDLIQFKNNIETYIEQQLTVINIDDNLYYSTNLLTVLNIELNTNQYCEELRCNSVVTPTTSSSIPTICVIAKRVKFLGTILGGAFAYNNAKMEEANFDTVTQIICNYSKQPFVNISNNNLVLKFPNLLKIIPANNYSNDGNVIFSNVKHLIIGEKLEALASFLFGGTCGTIELYCKNATNNLINGRLCNENVSVEHLYLCPDWNCPLNIRGIKNMTVENITEIFNNLKDLTNEDSKTFTIKSDLYDSLSANILAIATNKNWTIAYA